MQEWWDWDGIGKYKSRYHYYPFNLMLRDVQKRRAFAKHNEERIKINALWKNDILPKELREHAFREIQKPEKLGMTCKARRGSNPVT